MIGYRFSEFVPSEGSKSTFQKMLDIFLQLMLHTNGDVSEALNWMTQVDRKYQLSSDTYGMGDFVDDLRKEGYIKEDENGEVRLGGKSEQTIRKNSLEEIFGY